MIWGSDPGFRIAVAPELLLGGLSGIFVEDGKNLGAAFVPAFIAAFMAAFGADSRFVVGYVSVDDVLEPS